MFWQWILVFVEFVCGWSSVFFARPKKTNILMVELGVISKSSLI